MGQTVQPLAQAWGRARWSGGPERARSYRIAMATALSGSSSAKQRW